MPFPSAGCQTCKSRRIKCDEAQPACQRCIRSGRECQWMTTGKAWLIVHSENPYASGRKKRPRGPRSSQTRSTDLISNPDLILYRPVIDVKANAISYFSHYHLQTLEGTLTILKGVMTDFLPIWKSNAESSILDLAVSSVALAVYSRTQQHPYAAVEASKQYQELLRLQRAAITSLDQNSIDDCLIAIFFMGRFEDVVHSPGYPNEQAHSARMLHSFSHHDGALAILKYWRVHMYHTRPATDIIKYTRRGMIRSATLRVLGLPEWMWDGECFGEHGSELAYDAIVVQIVNLRHQVSMLHKDKMSERMTSRELISKASDLHDKARDLNAALQDWAGAQPSNLDHKRYILSGRHIFPTKYFYSSEVYIYSNPVHASAWILYYATRLLINSTLLKILSIIGPLSNSATFDRRFEYTSVMEATAKDLVLSIPCALQRFSATDMFDTPSQQNSIIINENEDIKPYVANLMIWPLSLSANLSGVDDRYKSWLRSLLAHLGRITGIALLESAETNSWPEL